MLNGKSGKAITSFGKLVLKKNLGNSIIIYDKRMRPTGLNKIPVYPVSKSGNDISQANPGDCHLTIVLIRRKIKLIVQKLD